MTRWILAGALILTAALVRAEGPDSSFLTEPGQKAPLFILEDTSGDIQKARPAGTVTLLHLFHCESKRCAESLQAIEEFLWLPLQGDDFRVLGVGVYSSKLELDRVRGELGLTFPLIADTEGRFFEMFARDGLPRTVIWDEEGEIVYQHAGYSPGRDAEFRVVVEALLDDQPMPGLPKEKSSGAGPVNPELFAIDIRGEQAPEVPVETWITPPAEDREGKYLLVDFWATWCGPCIQSLSLAEPIHHQFDEQLVSMAISDENPDRVESFVKKQKWSQPVGVDTQGRAKRELQVQGIPHAFVANPEGKVVWQGHPYSLWTNDAELLKKILDGQEFLK